MIIHQYAHCVLLVMKSITSDLTVDITNHVCEMQHWEALTVKVDYREFADLTDSNSLTQSANKLSVTVTAIDSRESDNVLSERLDSSGFQDVESMSIVLTDLD